MSHGFGAGMSLRGHTLGKCAELIQSGQYDVAITLLREMLAKNPSDPSVLHMLGMSLASVDHPREAIRHLKFASQLDSGNPEVFCTLAMAHRKLNQVRDAHQALDKALAIDPTHARAISVKSLLFQSSGQPEKALALISSAMVNDKDASLAVHFGQIARQLKRYSEGIDVVNAALERSEILKDRREELNYVLGHLYDAQGEYDRAFACFQRGNIMGGVEDADRIDAHLNKFRPEILDAMPVADVDASRAVFIVGMPRSGTTLTEQVIASHPQAGGVGESPVINEIVHAQPTDGLTQKIADDHAKRYIKMMDDAYPDPKILRVCDKMPENYLFLGTMSKILPGAHYIHCVRDARDTCLSIYFQRFGARLQYARDLVTCANQYLGYLKTMEYWRENLDINILDSRYEELTAEPQERVTALLEHIGLEFHPACLEHHKNKQAVHTASLGQVRSPIYKSSQQRWKNYEKHLGPMLEILDGV